MHGINYLKKNYLNGIEFPIGKTYEDILTTYKLISKANKITYLKDELYVYINRKKSISNSYNTKKMLDEICAINERYNLVKEKYPSLIDINIMNRIKFIYRYYSNLCKFKDYKTKELLNEYKFYKDNYKGVKKIITQYNFLYEILFLNRVLFYCVRKVLKIFGC